MKILLLTIYSNGMDIRYEELGICSVAGYLNENNYEVMLRGAKDNRINYKEITEYNPQVIGLTVYADSKKSVYHFIDKIKDILPNTKICLGGYAAFFDSEEMMSLNQNIDVCVRGEGEISFLEVVNCFENEMTLDNVEGITFRKGENIIVNRNREKIKNLEISYGNYTKSKECNNEYFYKAIVFNQFELH